MSTSSLVAVGGLLAHVAAQTTSPTVRAAVVFVHHGETTPSLVSDHIVLTPNGAQQMQRLGAAFRSRYLGDSVSNTTLSNDTDAAPVKSLLPDSIDNTQMAIMAATQEWSANSAAAFMQGLYPPNLNTSYLGQNFVLNANTMDYPLNGYQYAKIITYPGSDSNSVALQGYEACTAWQNQIGQNLSQSPEITDRVRDKAYLYTHLFSSKPMQGRLPVDQATYLNAEEIYRFVDFNYAYNETVHKGLKDPNGTLSLLQNNAFSLEQAKTSYGSNSNKDDDALSLLYSIAGRTLANKVTDQFSTFLATSGTRGKLTFMFGSPRSLVAFFGVAGLINDQNAAASPFSQLPKPGSAIAFELVSDSDSSSTTDSLQVRFSYRPSADSGARFSTYPLFGSGSGGAAMSYTSFFSKMNDISISPREWCTLCRPGSTSTFCVKPNFSGREKDGSSSSAISPAVGGVLGALLMAVLVACVAAGFMAFGGWRFRRNGSSGAGPAGSAGGGFKGSDKLVSDADMTVSNAGRREERLGSWELRGGGRETSAGPLGAGIVTGEFAQRARKMDEDEVSVAGAPVHAREGV